MAALILYVNGAPGIKYELDKTCVTIGRDFDSDICLDDPCVSKRHALIETKVVSLLDETYEHRLVDLDSTNACLVNNQRTTHALLADGDLVRIGTHLFKFAAEAGRPVPVATDRPVGDKAPELPTEVQLTTASGTHEFSTTFSRRLRML